MCDLSTQNTSLLLESNGETLRPLSNSNVKRVVAADNKFIFVPVNCGRAPFDILQWEYKLVAHNVTFELKSKGKK